VRVDARAADASAGGAQVGVQRVLAQPTWTRSALLVNALAADSPARVAHRSAPRSTVELERAFAAAGGVHSSADGSARVSVAVPQVFLPTHPLPSQWALEGQAIRAATGEHHDDGVLVRAEAAAAAAAATVQVGTPARTSDDALHTASRLEDQLRRLSERLQRAPAAVRAALDVSSTSGGSGEGPLPSASFSGDSISADSSVDLNVSAELAADDHAAAPLGGELATHHAATAAASSVVAVTTPLPASLSAPRDEVPVSRSSATRSTPGRIASMLRHAQRRASKLVSVLNGTLQRGAPDAAMRVDDSDARHGAAAVGNGVAAPHEGVAAGAGVHAAPGGDASWANHVALPPHDATDAEHASHLRELSGRMLVELARKHKQVKELLADRERIGRELDELRRTAVLTAAPPSLASRAVDVHDAVVPSALPPRERAASSSAGPRARALA
jgi:hypothetical protein